MNQMQRLANILYKAYKQQIELFWVEVEVEGDVVEHKYDNTFWSNFKNDQAVTDYIEEDFDLHNMCSIPSFSNWMELRAKYNGTEYSLFSVTEGYDTIKCNRDGISSLFKELK